MPFALALALTLLCAPALAVELSPGDLIVIDTNARAVVRVDPASGNRSDVSSSEVGEGTLLKAPWGIEQASDGRLIVVDLGTWAVYYVDLDSGDRSVITSKDVGSGDLLRLPRNFAIVPGGEPGASSAIVGAAAAAAGIAAGIGALPWWRSARSGRSA